MRQTFPTKLHLNILQKKRKVSLPLTAKELKQKLPDFHHTLLFLNGQTKAPNLRNV